jgi:glucosamine--fructose-6-phosphate aminotransferase (isomerizing)
MVGQGIRRLLRRLPRVAVGRDPRSLPPGTLVLLPVRRATLHCGLAGFVEVARPEPFAAPDPAEIGRLARDASALPVRALAADPGRVDAYAGGDRVPAELLAAARTLRRPAALDLGERLAPLEAAAEEAARAVRGFCDSEEAALEEVAARLPAAAQEAVAARLLVLRDAAWSLDAEFLGMLARARDLAGPGAPPKLVREMRKVTSTLDAVDRIEVRGRDSAGIVVMATFPSSREREDFAAGLARAGLGGEYGRRREIPDLLDGAVAEAVVDGPGSPAAVSFVRKVAAEVGKLGDNVAALRARIRSDGVLRAALAHPASRVVVLGHTRWASNGIIHEANAHPVDNATVPAGSPDEADRVRGQGDPHPVYGRARGRVFVALNGDVDNHFDLHDAYEKATGFRGSPRVTTDTKVIALQVDRRLREGKSLEEAFRGAVADLDGSAAVAMVSDLEPGRVFLSLRGSGQSLYVGLAPDGWVVSSEVYGLVHETSAFTALEGERERVPGDRGSKGTVAVLDPSGPGGPPRLLSFGGAPLDAEAAPRAAEITTRDVDRGPFPHFFRKEIEQSPLSVAKTLRGKLVLEGEGGRCLRLNLGAESLPPALEERLKAGRIRRIACIGQGTASVAAAAVAALLEQDLGPAGLAVRAWKATELSGFGLRDDMSDTLVVAVTQSGSTADTNRAVDLARRRGAAVIAIVNRRNSDITRRADGVFHTSDGRDVEMSVASTKAFHAQVAAGGVLSLALARILGTLSESEGAERAAELRRIPDLLREVLALDGAIAGVAAAHAPTRRHWAVVGSGLGRIAAEEVRIKCSELCYKSISADTVEDKKHIDLSSEPLMLVFAAGSPPAVQGDLAKDVAIFQAHKALPVVFAERGDRRFDPYAAAVVPLPPASPRLAMLASVMAGHLFAYHAARAIDEGARFFSRLRADLVAEAIGGGVSAGPALEQAARLTMERIGKGRFECALGPNQAARIALLLHGVPGSGPDAAPAGADATIAALTELIRELERPVDAIRHQAKIVTVGTSRIAERPAGPLFDALAEAGVAFDDAPEAAVAALRAVQPAVARVEGWARYRVEGLAGDGAPTEASRLVIEKRGGISSKLPSRAEGGAPLKGTKRGVVGSRRPFVGIGAKDGRSLVILPLLDARLHCTSLALLHVEFLGSLPVPEKAALLGHRRLEEVVNGVAEADVTWTDSLLGPVSPKHLACLSAERIVEEIVARARGRGEG